MKFFLLTLLVFAADQISKKLVLKSGIFVYKNFGITFGLFPGNASAIIIYRIITLFLNLLIIRYFYITLNKRDFLTTISLSFILGGSLGNTFDRISRGYVPDFINLRVVTSFWPLGWYNNLADVFIVTGVIILLGNQLVSKNRIKKLSL